MTAQAETEIARARAAAARRRGERQAESTFWFQRAITSLAIGSGAAFVVIAGGVFQAGDVQLAAQLSLYPMLAFALSLISAGLVPFLLAAYHEPMPEFDKNSQQVWLPAFRRWERSTKFARLFIAAFTIGSGVLFVCGCALSIASVRSLSLAEVELRAPAEYELSIGNVPQDDHVSEDEQLTE